MTAEQVDASLVRLWENAEELVFAARMVQSLELRQDSELDGETRAAFADVAAAIDDVMDAYDIAREAAAEMTALGEPVLPVLHDLGSDTWLRSLPARIQDLSAATGRATAQYLDDPNRFFPVDAPFIDALVVTNAAYAVQPDTAAAWRQTNTLRALPGTAHPHPPAPDADEPQPRLTEGIDLPPTRPHEPGPGPEQPFDVGVAPRFPAVIHTEAGSPSLLPPGRPTPPSLRP